MTHNTYQKEMFKTTSTIVSVYGLEKETWPLKYCV